MSTAVMSDSMVMTAGLDGPLNVNTGLTEVVFASCECCGLQEECTPSYIDTICQRYGGKWVCGLCAEAVKDEILRCQKLISPDEAMDRHSEICKKFRASGPPQDPTLQLIRAMGRVMRRGLESPKSAPSSPTTRRSGKKGAVLTRSESCIPKLTLVEAPVYNEE